MKQVDQEYDYVMEKSRVKWGPSLKELDIALRTWIAKEDEGPAVADPLNTQEGGEHYKKLGDYQPWVVLAKWLTPDELRGFAKGTVIAYLARERDKGGLLDIKKAVHTLQIYLSLIDEEGNVK